MREINIDEIRARTLDMMDHIHSICEANGIQYYLFFGTLLGAVRHNGFIPWDDDFDIAMKREDYIKFCDIVEKEKHPYYKLCNRKNTTNYYYGIARYSDMRFKYVSDYSTIKNFEIGIFIDVYPLDNFGNSLEESKYIKKKVQKLNADFMIYINRISLKSRYRSWFRTLAHFFYRIKYGRDFQDRIEGMIYKMILKLTDDDDRYIGEVCWDKGVVPCEKEWFREATLHKFEDREYWIPIGYKEILREEYGDYMKLPPKNERHFTHSYKMYEK